MNIPKKRQNVASWSECSKWCSTLDGCKAWTYSTIQRTCTAKTNNKQRRTAKGFVSGPRHCTEESEYMFISSFQNLDAPSFLLTSQI